MKEKLEGALILYQPGKVSLGKASEIADICIWEFLDILKERKLEIKIDEKELKRQLCPSTSQKQKTISQRIPRIVRSVGAGI